MPKSERYNTILSLLNERGYLSVEELSRMIYVSPSTLRRDLAEMSRSGYIKRSWGGVMALTPSEAEDAVVHQESASLTPEQAAIAQAAAKYLREDDVTYLDASGLVLGMIPSSAGDAGISVPNIFGIEGPVISTSIRAVFLPARFAAQASRDVTMDFPTPPLPLTIPITFLMSDASFCGTSRFCGSVREPQFLLQLEQS